MIVVILYNRGMKNKFPYIQRCGFKGHPNANKNGVILEHRLFMAEHLKRALTKDEIVHHINGDPKDNRIENLQIISRKEHVKKHNKPRKYVRLICKSCNKVFFKPNNQVATKKNCGQKDFYCNRNCMGTHFGRGRNKL